MARFPPRLPSRAIASYRPLDSLPDPRNTAAWLQGSSFATQCLLLAEEILRHRFPIFGETVETGPDIRWRLDPAAGIESESVYFRRIPYLDATRAGDHKRIWEINRHQHLVLLAQAHLFSGREDFIEEIVLQLESWNAQNPFQYSINWASALEVAFRALSWIWVYHLVGDRFADPFRRRFLEALYRHGLHLEANLSYYFAPNTHLLGEAVALHALGHLFPQFPQAKHWEETGDRVVAQEFDRQVLPDGCHFELSTYYHVYALDMFLFHAVLRRGSPLAAGKLRRMASFLDAIIGSSGILPLIGDDDGGRFFHPYGPRSQFAHATLATCGAFLDHSEWIHDPHDLEVQAAWLLAVSTPSATAKVVDRQSLRFEDSGLIVMAAQNVQAIVDAGPFGPGRAGHSHADTLSLCVRLGQEQILIDPGTYTYVADPLWRDRFRGTAAHNTVRIDGLNQATASGPFAWQSRPQVEVLEWKTSPEQDIFVAACPYSGFRHQRKIVFDKQALWILILDDLEGARGEHHIQQFWHFGAPVQPRSPSCFHVGAKAAIAFDGVEPRLSEGGEYGWISPVLGTKFAAPVACVEQRLTLPASLAVLIDLSGGEKDLSAMAHALRLKWSSR